MAYTYKDNEKVALEIVKAVRGKVIRKWVDMNDAACMIFTTPFGPLDVRYKTELNIKDIIRKVNPDCKLDMKSEVSYVRPKGSSVSTTAGVLAVRDVFYDKDYEYYGTEIYVAACSTPSVIVWCITVCLEGE